MRQPYGDFDLANIMQQLKEGTRDCHDSAESQEFQRLLASAELPRNLYVKYLEQLWIIHSRLEAHLRALIKKDDSLAQIISEDQMQVPYLRQDLEFFGCNPEHGNPTTATKSILDKLDSRSKSGLSLIGAHYVLLGSKHGGKYIAHSLQTKLHLNEGKGAMYFDPYGTNFQQVWKSFSAGLNSLTLSVEEEAAMVLAAREMFEGIGKLSEEMVQMQVGSALN